MTRIPFIVFGDGPRLSSGLARIARDLTARLWAASEELGIRVVQVGVDEPGGWHFEGGWEFYGFQPTMHDFGRSAIHTVWGELFDAHQQSPIILAITDPARVYDLTRVALPGEQTDYSLDRLWGYFPIDAHNPRQAVGGPAAAAVRSCERILGYGKYGAGVLKRTLELASEEKYQPYSVPYLPHGIDTHTFLPRPLEEADSTFRQWRARVPKGATILGCVAANQPRKDLGLLFSSVAAVKQGGRAVGLWLHTDLLTGRAWDVGELAVQFGFRREEVLVTAGYLQDTALAARYTDSALTIAPGLGEGFGYPIVESLACGTPVIHGNYAGGVELIPNPRWLVEPSGWRVESVYVLLRPVFSPVDVARAVEECLAHVQRDPASVRAYCRGAVQHLDWEFVWPRWRSWIRKGLTSGRGSARPVGLPGTDTPDAPSPERDAGADAPISPSG